MTCNKSDLKKFRVVGIYPNVDKDMTCNTPIINKALGGNVTSSTDKKVMSLLLLTSDIHYLAFIKVTLDCNEALTQIYILYIK